MEGAGETVGRRAGAGSSGEGVRRGRVRVCLCVLHTHPHVCVPARSVCVPRVPTRCVHMSVGRAPRAHPAAQPAAHSWARGAVSTTRCEVAGV